MAHNYVLVNLICTAMPIFFVRLQNLTQYMSLFSCHVFRVKS